MKAKPIVQYAGKIQITLFAYRIIFSSAGKDGDWELKARSDGKTDENNSCKKIMGRNCLCGMAPVPIRAHNMILLLTNGIPAPKAEASMHPTHAGIYVP